MINWAYIAGFTDGEGTIDSRGGYMRIYQKNLDVLRRIHEFLASQDIYSTLATRKERKTNFLVIGSESHLQLGAKEMLKVIPKLLPYLIVKKTVAQDFVRFKTLYPPMTPLQASKIASDYYKNRQPIKHRDPKTGRIISVKSA